MTPRSPDNPICVALDGRDAAWIRDVANSTHSYVGMFKVGLTTFASAGPELVGELVALGAGADGLVCSPLEVGSLRDRFGARAHGGPLLVVPGIRPAGANTGDQRRTLAPSEALRAGADVLVIGRPITAASDPGGAAAAILESLT